MKAPTLDELVLLPEPLALHRHFDGRNYRVFRWLLILTTMLCLGGVAASIDHHDGVGLAIYIADALACIALFILRDRDVFARNFRQILLVFLFSQIVVLKVATSHITDDHVPFFLTVFALLAFRLRVSEHLMLFAAFWGTAVFPLEWIGLRRVSVAVAQDAIAALSVMSLICLATAIGVTQLDRKRFLAGWRKE